MDFLEAGRFVAYVAAAYFLGSLPTGYWMGLRLKGVDLRKVGSGNTGATNVFRNLGAGPGLAVLLLDMGKGWAAVALLPHLFGMSTHGWAPLAGSLASVAGHDFTPFLGFKGGKGVATSTGALLGLAPLSTLACLGVFGAVLASTRMVSVGSLAGAVLLPLFIWLFNEGGSGALAQAQPVLWLALVLSAFVWIKHIPNLKRLVRGEENRLRFGKKPPSGGDGHA